MAGKGNSKVVAGSSIGLGSILAVVMSWTVNKAFLWAIFHGILGWIYVVYYLITRNDWSWL